MTRFALVCSILIFSACALDTPEPTRPEGGPSSTLVSSTSSPTSTSPTGFTTTTASSLPEARPPLYRFGMDGLFRVVGSEVLLVAEPVAWARDDLMGGVIFRLHSQTDPSATWMKRDGSTTRLHAPPIFLAMVGGEPVAVSIGRLDTEGVDDIDLVLTGLDSGRRRTIDGEFFLGDGWSLPASVGGETFVGIEGAAFGCGQSDAFISLWDLTGKRLARWDPSDASLQPPDSPTGPCGPCELSAALSPDGSVLAYTVRLDAPSEYHRRLDCGDREAWWTETRAIPGRLAVAALSDGTMLYSAETGPQVAITDFDGRYLVVQEYGRESTAATIHDSWGAESPRRIPGNAVLYRPSVDADQMSQLLLRGDGIGSIEFGATAEETLDHLTRVLGAPEILDRVEAFGRASSVFYGGPDATRLLALWRHSGVVVAFSDHPFFRDDGALHFTGWGVTAVDGAAQPGTLEGVTVGTKSTEAAALLGSRFVREDSVCGPWVYIAPSDDELPKSQIAVFMQDDSIIGLHAGASPGC